MGQIQGKRKGGGCCSLACNLVPGVVVPPNVFSRTNKTTFLYLLCLTPMSLQLAYPLGLECFTSSIGIRYYISASAGKDEQPGPCSQNEGHQPDVTIKSYNGDIDP